MLAAALVWLSLSAALPAGLPAQDGIAPTTDLRSGYRLGPADVLMVTVIGVDEFASKNKPGLELVVSNSGKIHVPYAGVMRVHGMTTAELETAIAQRLRDQDLVKDPQVTVRVSSYRGNTIYILGEVMQPGQYYMREDMYLIDLLGLSMGFPTDGIMYLYRRAPVEPDAAAGQGERQVLPGETVVNEAVPIDIQELAEGRRPDLNLRLQAGDMLYVPFNRARYFYVTGEVSKAGPFEIPPKREVLVSQAIAFAGGPMKTAKLGKGLLVRYDEQGQRQEIALDVGAIMKGESPDFPVQENDIIFIPGSQVKTLGYGLLSIVPNMVMMGIW